MIAQKHRGNAVALLREAAVIFRAVEDTSPGSDDEADRQTARIGSVLAEIEALLAAAPEPRGHPSERISELVAHVGCGDMDAMFGCSECQAIRRILRAAAEPRDEQEKA